MAKSWLESCDIMKIQTFARKVLKLGQVKMSQFCKTCDFMPKCFNYMPKSLSFTLKCCNLENLAILL